MNKKNKNPDYKYMHVYLNQCVKKNMGKAMISVLIFAFLQAFIYVLAILPISMTILQDNNSIILTIVSFVFIVAANLLCNMINYGLNVLITRMVEKKYVTLGYLFFGFRNNTKKVFKASLVFTFIYSIVILTVSVLMVVFSSSLLPLFQEYTNVFAIIMTLVVFILLFIFISPFAFVYINIYSQPNTTVKEAFRLSRKIMFSHYFNAIGFLFYCGGLDLLIAIAVNIINVVIPSDDNVNTALSFISAILGFIGFVCEYRALVNMYVSVPIYYYSIMGIIQNESDIKQKSLEPEEDTVVLIEDNRNGE